MYRKKLGAKQKYQRKMLGYQRETEQCILMRPDIRKHSCYFRNRIKLYNAFSDTCYIQTKAKFIEQNGI